MCFFIVEISDSIRYNGAQHTYIKGDAEAEYNRKISASLSPLIVQQNFVDRWDGKLPTYGTVPQLFKDVAGK